MATLEMQKVLVVDEGSVPTVREALRDIERVEIVVEKDPALASRALASAIFDLVITDALIPQLGLEMLRRVSPLVPIIMLTVDHLEPVAGLTRVAPTAEALRTCLAALMAGRVHRPAPAPVPEDPALVRANRTRDRFASAVQRAVGEHHAAGRDVVVQRDGELVRVAPPRT